MHSQSVKYGLMLSPQDFCSASQQARSPSSWITLFLLYTGKKHISKDLCISKIPLM